MGAKGRKSQVAPAEIPTRKTPLQFAGFEKPKMVRIFLQDINLVTCAFTTVAIFSDPANVVICTCDEEVALTDVDSTMRAMHDAVWRLGRTIYNNHHWVLALIRQHLSSRGAIDVGFAYENSDSLQNRFTEAEQPRHIMISRQGVTIENHNILKLRVAEMDTLHCPHITMKPENLVKCTKVRDPEIRRTNSNGNAQSSEYGRLSCRHCFV